MISKLSIVACLLALLSWVILYESQSVNAEADSTFIKAISENTAKISAEELLPQLFQDAPKQIENSAVMTHKQLLERYSEAFAEFQKVFPELRELRQNTAVIASFTGSAKMINPDVHAIPISLIHPTSADFSKPAFYRQRISYGEKDIPVLILRTTILPFWLNTNTPHEVATDYYMPSLNARAFGFKKAQLILPLSKNVRPGTEFYYNGYHTWSEHKRYRQNDQVSKAIELTNVVHHNGSSYAISDHPDFSLELLKYKREPVIMTFFLWRDAVTATPDLIYRIEYQLKK